MTLPGLSQVRLLTDRYRDKGVPAGTLGTILEVYDDGAYEVEFSDPADGTTIALLSLAEEEVEAVPVEERSGRLSG